jgi:hypothetical protein
MDDLHHLQGTWAQIRFEENGIIVVFIAADEVMPRPVEFATSPGLTLRGFIRRAAP